MKFFNKKILNSLLLVFIFFVFGIKSEAAVLMMKPSQSEISVGNIINIQVAVDTLGKFINNAESIIQFPKDLLEVVS